MRMTNRIQQQTVFLERVWHPSLATVSLTHRTWNSPSAPIREGRKESHAPLPRTGLLRFGRSIRRQYLDDGLVERVVGCSYLNAYLPVTSHEQIVTCAEVALAIGLCVVGLGSHVHVQLGDVERYAYVGDGRHHWSRCARPRRRLPAAS